MVSLNTKMELLQADWEYMSDGEREYYIDKAHAAAIVDNFTWELTRPLVPLVEWLATQLNKLPESIRKRLS